MSLRTDVKIVSNPELVKQNEERFKQKPKQDKKTLLVNGKEKVVSIKTYSTGDKNKGVRKSSLVSITKKGKRIG